MFGLVQCYIKKCITQINSLGNKIKKFVKLFYYKTLCKHKIMFE